MATLVSVNVGMPADVAWQGRTVHTGIWKRSVPGRRLVRRLNVDGDGQGDLGGHGGEQRAVLVYQLDSYRHWQQHFGRDDFEYGQFGENFTVDGLADDDVCIGDRYRIGDAEFEVTQPRVTCFRVGMRLGQPQLPALLVAHRRPGFYLRVIAEGSVAAGDEIVRAERGRHALTVADIDGLLYLPDRDLARVRDAVDVPALSPGWQQSFRELLAGADAAAPSWTGFRRLRVVDVTRESSVITSVYLASADGESLPTARPGQYLTVRLDGAPAPVRTYSLSSAPGADIYRISVKRESHGAVSTYLNTRLHAGDTIDVAAPRGEFVLDDSASSVLLVSAGIGITPVLAMLHSLAAAHDPRPVWWIHVARDLAQQAFAIEARELVASLPNGHEHVFLTAAGTDTTVPGRPTAERLATLGIPADATAYICGPDGFMAAMQNLLAAIGLSTQRIRTERFGARSALTPGIVGSAVREPHQPPGPAGTGPEITFARSGLSTRWSGNQPSLLELAEACDVPTRWSCRTGVCHTCVTPTLSGQVDYAPLPLEPPPAGTALLCCARPDGDLVLDL